MSGGKSGGAKVITLPSAYAPSEAPPARARPYVTDIDSALFDLADLGVDGGELRQWLYDRPLTSEECAAALSWFNASPAHDVARRSAILRDYCTQLEMQADGFTAAAAALLARDARRLWHAARGNGAAETRRLLDLADDLLGAHGLTKPEAQQAVSTKIVELAAAFQRAASACREWFNFLHAARDARDGDRLAARVADLTQRQKDAQP
jgi:hypothetical protein